MGLFDLFRKRKGKEFQQEFNDMMNEYMNFVENNKTKILDSEDTTGEYYDNIFDDLMLSSGFFYPHKSQNADDIEFMVIPPDIKYANKNSQKGLSGLFVYLWLRDVSEQNIILHNHLLSLFTENQQLSIEEHLNYIQSIIKNDSLTQIIRDTKILQAISIRLRTYCSIIEKLAATFFTFYIEHEDDCVQCLLEINKEYMPTTQIKNSYNLTITDIEYIFIRDTLSRGDLAQEENKFDSENSVTQPDIFVDFNEDVQIDVHNCSLEYSDNELDNALFIEVNKPMLNRGKIRSLIAQGANINAYDKNGYDVFQNLLFYQISQDMDEDDFEINLDDIQFAIDMGADVNNPIKSKGQEGYNCLYLAVCSEGLVKQHTTTVALIEMLLKAGADPNMYDGYESILDAAISSGGHYDHTQKEWIDDGTMDDVIELLEKYDKQMNKNILTDIQIQKIKKCIDIANEYLTEEGYKLKDYSLNECCDLISLWKEKGLPSFLHWSGATGGGCIGFKERIRIECITKWHKILTNKEISAEILNCYLDELSDLLHDKEISVELLKDFNFPLSEISEEKEQLKPENQDSPNYTIFWQQYSPNSQVGQYWQVTENFALPYFAVKDKRDAPEKQVLFGILIGYNDNPPAVNIEYTRSLFPKILRHLQKGFDYESLEKLILDVAANLRENVDDLLSYRVLINGTEIEPSSSKIKFDCAMSLYNLILKNDFSDIEKGKSILRKLVNNINKNDINPNFVLHLNRVRDFVNIEAEQQPEENGKTSLFIDENGEPQIITHSCPPERTGREMTKEELHRFAVELLSDLYEKAGMTIINVNRHYGREFPNLVMESKNRKRYYIIIETACFPQKAESLYSRDFSEMKKYAKEHNAIPVFAGMSFLNMDRGMDNNRIICGDSYVVAFKGLETM
jgi:hypothetical protein